MEGALQALVDFYCVLLVTAHPAVEVQEGVDDVAEVLGGKAFLRLCNRGV